MLDIQEMAGGACDGASVMLGVHNGVVSRLKAMVSHFIHTHCAAHRLSLRMLVQLPNGFNGLRAC